MPLTKEVIADAVRKAIELGKGKRFKQSVELIVVLPGINPKTPEGRFRETITLPHGLGKDVKILVIASGDTLLKAREAGVDAITLDDLKAMNKRQIKKLARTYDWVLVRADLMGHVGRILGPALGPRGKAPVVVPINADIKAFIERYKRSIRLRNKEQPWVGCRVGTEDMDPEKLAENIMTVLEAIKNKVKRELESFAEIYVKTTMGPSVEVLPPPKR